MIAAGDQLPYPYRVCPKPPPSAARRRRMTRRRSMTEPGCKSGSGLAARRNCAFAWAGRLPRTRSCRSAARRAVRSRPAVSRAPAARRSRARWVTRTNLQDLRRERGSRWRLAPSRPCALPWCAGCRIGHVPGTAEPWPQGPRIRGDRNPAKPDRIAAVRRLRTPHRDPTRSQRHSPAPLRGARIARNIAAMTDIARSQDATAATPTRAVNQESPEPSGGRP